MHAAYSVVVGNGSRVEARFGDRRDGDVGIDNDDEGLDDRRRQLCEHPWTILRQVHGADVVRPAAPGDGWGTEGDAMVTVVPGAALAINTADCVPVLLAGHRNGQPIVGACHAGWKGLYAGVIEATVTDMRRGGGFVEHAWVGPSISPAAYEFSVDDLTTMALRFGPDVVSATSQGRPALDARRAALEALASVAVDDVVLDTACTATAVDGDGARFFSWRARSDRGRQASIVWIVPS